MGKLLTSSFDIFYLYWSGACPPGFQPALVGIPCPHYKVSRSIGSVADYPWQVHMAAAQTKLLGILLLPPALDFWSILLSSSYPSRGLLQACEFSSRISANAVDIFFFFSNRACQAQRQRAEHSLGQGGSLQILTVSGLSSLQKPTALSLVRHRTWRSCVPFPQVTEHWGGREGIG